MEEAFVEQFKCVHYILVVRVKLMLIFHSHSKFLVRVNSNVLSYFKPSIKEPLDFND